MHDEPVYVIYLEGITWLQRYKSQNNEKSWHGGIKPILTQMAKLELSSWLINYHEKSK